MWQAEITLLLMVSFYGEGDFAIFRLFVISHAHQLWSLPPFGASAPLGAILHNTSILSIL
jgi:hypothetical protein